MTITLRSLTGTNFSGIHIEHDKDNVLLVVNPTNTECISKVNYFVPINLKLLEDTILGDNTNTIPGGEGINTKSKDLFWNSMIQILGAKAQLVSSTDKEEIYKRIQKYTTPREDKEQVGRVNLMTAIFTGEVTVDQLISGEYDIDKVKEGVIEQVPANKRVKLSITKVKVHYKNGKLVNS